MHRESNDAANAYTTRKGQAPKGLQSFLEPIIIFVRDEVVRKSIGERLLLQMTRRTGDSTVN